MPLIHLIRHGETDGNRLHYVGRKDLPLNATGRAQADALADRLADFPITRIIASPLQRAVQTARPLADRLDLPVELDGALIEFDFGVLQDLRKSDYALDLRKQHHLVPVAGGESLKDVWDRLLPLVAALNIWMGSGGDIVLFGHYWSNRVLLGILSGLSFAEILHIRDYKPGTGTSITIDISDAQNTRSDRDLIGRIP
jgi:broad specificity phosphatase PhoE